MNCELSNFDIKNHYASLYNVILTSTFGTATSTLGTIHNILATTPYLQMTPWSCKGLLHNGKKNKKGTKQFFGSLWRTTK